MVRYLPVEQTKEGIAPTKLTAASLHDGSYDECFQVITSRTNTTKREVCKACVKGEIIPLPPSIEPFRSAYRQTYEENPNACEGCFWHNNLKPKNENLCPDLVGARAKHRAEVVEVMKKAK